MAVPWAGCRWRRGALTEPASHTLAYLRRIDHKLDQLGSEPGELRSEVRERLNGVEGRLGRIEDELLVVNRIALRLEGREVETTGLKAIRDRHERALAERARRIAELEGAKEEGAGSRIPDQDARLARSIRDLTGRSSRRDRSGSRSRLIHDGAVLGKRSPDEQPSSFAGLTGEGVR